MSGKSMNGKNSKHGKNSKNGKQAKGGDDNFLEYIPKRNETLSWREDENGIVTLDVENTGFFNRMAQKLFRRPGITQIHLDELGSFVWPLIDGQTNIIELGTSVDARFGQAAAPLYERLAKFFQVLESYHFIELLKQEPGEM